MLSGDGLFSELETDWKELVGDSASATPFQTHQWTSTWWKHFGTAKSPYALALYDGADMVGLFPFVVTRGVWRALRPMGVGASDYLHPLARTGYEPAVNRAVAEYVREFSADLIDLHQVRQDKGEFDEGERIEQAVCLVLDLPDRFDAYVSGLSKSLRYDVKRMEKIAGASVQTIGRDDTRQGLECLFELHRARWRKRGLPGAFLRSSMRFHQEWAEKAQKEGWLWLSVLQLDGRPAGAIYAMRVGTTAYYYQAGFDPVRGSVSPGTLLVASTIRRSIEEGVRRFDFLRGDEPYKRRWKPQHVYKNFRTISRGQGAMGRLGSKWNSMGFMVESRIRARLEGRGLI